MVVAIISASMFILLIVVASFLLFRKFTKRKNHLMLEKRMITSHYEKALLQAQLEIQEQTFKNISQEIHDNIGQSLSLVKLNLNTLDVSNEATATGKIESTKELVSKAIHDLRDLSRSLNTDTILASGLHKAIELEMGIVERTGAINTQLTVEGKPCRFDPKKELILFRIFQEAINNVIRHAEANMINIRLDYGLNQLALTIRDDGKGFEMNIQGEGSGLRNMKNRASLIGALFDVQTGASGTTISIILPITEV